MQIDPLRTRQILLNIVGNAIKFTDHGQINVCLDFETSHDQPRRGLLTILVSDTGVGIDMSDQVAIFEPFRQADSSFARRHGGTGLGLGLSRILAHAMDGSVDLIKSQKGVGSVFRIRLLVGIGENAQWCSDLASARMSSKRTSVKIPQIANLSGRRILLVEDSADNRALIGSMLKRFGAIIEFANSGEEGVALADSQCWDVILMDMQMPGIDGYQATSILRKKGYSGPIIALTAHALTEEHDHSLNVGCNAHVTKPVNWNHLVSVIADLCTTSEEVT